MNAGILSNCEVRGNIPHLPFTENKRLAKNNLQVFFFSPEPIQL